MVVAAAVVVVGRPAKNIRIAFGRRQPPSTIPPPPFRARPLIVGPKGPRAYISARGGQEFRETYYYVYRSRGVRRITAAG